MSPLAGQNWNFEKLSFFNFFILKVVRYMWKHRTFVRRFRCCIFHQHILELVTWLEQATFSLRGLVDVSNIVSNMLVLFCFSGWYIKIPFLKVCIFTYRVFMFHAVNTHIVTQKLPRSYLLRSLLLAALTRPQEHSSGLEYPIKTKNVYDHMKDAMRQQVNRSSSVRKYTHQ